MNWAQAANAEAVQAYQQQAGHPMHGYTSPAQIEAARASAAYYNAHPGGMSGWADEGLSGLGADLLDQKTLTYAAIGAIAGMFLLPKKSKTMSLGIGAAAGVLASKML